MGAGKTGRAVGSALKNGGLGGYKGHGEHIRDGEGRLE